MFTYLLTFVSVSCFPYSQGVAKDELERLTLEKFNALKIDYITCPGQSMNHYGSQANNKHFVELKSSLLCSPTLGIWFNTDAGKAEPSGAINNIAARESGRYHGITINVNDEERIMREIYLTKDSSQPLTTYQFELPKSKAAMDSMEEEDREEKRQKISHPNAAKEEDATNDVSMLYCLQRNSS